MTRLIMFKLIFTIITVTLLLFQVVIWKKLQPRLSGRPRFKIWRALYFAIVFCSQSILWIGIFYPGRGVAMAFPDWYLPIHKILLAINYAHFFWLLPVSLVWLVGMVWRRLVRPDPAFGTPLLLGGSGETLSRGAFLRRAGGIAATGINLLPAATSVAAISGMFLGSKEIWRHDKPIAIKDLHDDLKGLRLVQISDIHVGNLIHEKYLSFAFDLIRQANPDYVLVTGDIIDNNNAFLPIAGHFFSKLNALIPGRVFGVMGNHDYIHDGDIAARELNAAGLRMLTNEAVRVKRARGNLQLAGLDYPSVGIAPGRGPIGKQSRHVAMQKFFQETRRKLSPEFPVILLNHHPSDFEYLKTQKIDLVLSGHTHGGQIQLSKDRESFFNGATWLYKYYVDHYEEQGSQLYVNRGLGHWFPLRIDSPPEITVFTLV